MQRSYLGDLELGRRNPSLRTLVKVANAFGLLSLPSLKNSPSNNGGGPNTLFAAQGI